MAKYQDCVYKLVKVFYSGKWTFLKLSPLSITSTCMHLQLIGKIYQSNFFDKSYSNKNELFYFISSNTVSVEYLLIYFTRKFRKKIDNLFEIVWQVTEDIFYWKMNETFWATSSLTWLSYLSKNHKISSANRLGSNLSKVASSSIFAEDLQIKGAKN